MMVSKATTTATITIVRPMTTTIATTMTTASIPGRFSISPIVFGLALKSTARQCDVIQAGKPRKIRFC